MGLEKHKIVAIIITFNGLKWISKCLDSLRNSTIKILPIVIDNNSIDKTAEFVSENYKEVFLIRCDENLGFGKANNIGIRKAKEINATHILLLNQDTYIQKDLLTKLLLHDNNNSLLSPVHLNGNGTDFDYNFKHYTLRSDYHLNNSNNKTQAIDVKFVNAACWLLPIKIINEIGGFNPLFTHYGEDNNYIQRLEYHKFSIKVILNSFVNHDREKYGNKTVFDNGFHKRTILLIGLNINFTYSVVIKKLFVQTLKLPYYLIKFRFKEFGAQFKQLFFISFKVGQIKASRKLEKRQGLSWLK